MRPARPSGARTFFMVFLALGAATLPGAARAQEELLQELKSVASVRLEGNRHLGTGAIRRVMKTRSPSIFPWRARPVLRFDFLNSDTLAIEALYRHYGYLDANAAYEVHSTRDPDEVEVVFHVREGDQSHIRAVELDGLRNVPERDVRRRLWSRPDRPFDPAFLQLDTLIISTLYHERGYRPHIYGEARRESIGVTVRYEVTEGDRYHVGTVYVIRPDQRFQVEERLIRRELLLQPGDFYSIERVRRSQERLYESGLFSQVLIEALPDSSQTLVDYKVTVRERKPRWIDAGIGGGTEEAFRLTGEWGHRNLLGRGLQGALASRLSYYGYNPNEPPKFQRWRGEASLLEPWLFRSRTRAQLTPYYERYHDRANPDFVVEQGFAGVDIQLRRELTRYLRVLLTQRNIFAHQHVTVVRPESLTTVESDFISRVNDTYNTHRLELALERDFRDNPFLPTRGSYQLLSGQYAGGPLQGASSFAKVEFLSSWYTPLPRGLTLASRLRAGTMDPIGGGRAPFSPDPTTDPRVAQVPVEDRFRAGGVNSIRGFRENTIPPGGNGGLTVLLASLELRVPTPWRIPFLGPLGVETYLDAGNVWAQPRYIQWDQFRPSVGRAALDDFDVRYAVGLGPRIDLPIGPLRVDATWTLRPSTGGPEFGRPRWQFAIGPSF